MMAVVSIPIVSVTVEGWRLTLRVLLRLLQRLLAALAKLFRRLRRGRGDKGERDYRDIRCQRRRRRSGRGRTRSFIRSNGSPRGGLRSHGTTPISGLSIRLPGRRWIGRA